MATRSISISKNPAIAPSTTSQPIPQPPATPSKQLAQRLERLTIQAPPNSPDGSPRKEASTDLRRRATVGVDIFKELEFDFAKFDPVSPIKPNRVREQKPDFEMVFIPSNFGDPEAPVTDKMMLDKPSFPWMTSTAFSLPNPEAIVPMPSPPPEPIKKRPAKEQLPSSSEPASEVKDLTKKRFREAKEGATPYKNVRRVRARLLDQFEAVAEKKEDSSSLQPFGQKIEMATSLPFCTPDKMKMFFNFTINPKTHIWSGMCGEPGYVGQINSFLPPNTDEDQFKTVLEQVLTSGDGFIVQRGNKFLFQLGVNEDNLFYIEVELFEGTIRSVQPIFHFEKYDEAIGSIQVQYFSQQFIDASAEPCVYEIPYSQLLDLVKAHFSTPSFKYPIAYENEDTLFIDVSVLDKDCPIKGLIIAIPKSVIENWMTS